MKGSTQPVTAAGITTQTETAKNVVIPLSNGLTFTCNGKAIPLLKDVCSATTAIGILQAGKAGKITHIKVYNPTPLF
jgi:branched-chain amino acid transport system substrate-binding protein